jgi:hypothetical protein
MCGQIEVHLVEAEVHRLRDPKAMPVDQQQEDVVADAVPPLLGRLEQALHFGVGQEVLSPSVPIDRFRLVTLSISTFGRHRLLVR